MDHSEKLTLIRDRILSLLEETTKATASDPPLETILLVEEAFYGRRFRKGACFADWLLESDEIRFFNENREIMHRVEASELAANVLASRSNVEVSRKAA